MSSSGTIPIPWKRISYSVVAFISLILLYIVPEDSLTRYPIFIIGGFIGAFHFLMGFYNHVFIKHKITTDVIMTLAVVGAGILGEFEESMTIIFLYSITETLESYTVRRTKYSIKSLVKLVPQEVTIVENGVESREIIENIAKGDTIRIKVGDVIPTDGTILNGSAAIDESTITGEPLPVYKTVGDPLLSGTSCADGTIIYEVTKLPSESTVNKIIEMVEEAQSKKVPVQLTIEKFTKYYNPGILIFSFLVFLLPAFITSDFQTWAILGVTLLVASSPCALAISSPVAMYSAISTSANKGILVKGGVFLEELGAVDAVVFDKTGTLTHGEPVLSDIIAIGDFDHETLLELAGSLEQYSNHPLAKAVIKKIKADHLTEVSVDTHTTLPGIGVSGMIDGQSYFFGNNPEDIPDDTIQRKLTSLAAEGKSVSYLSKNGNIIGIFGFTDRIRESVIHAVDELQRKGIPVFMLTGDNKDSALSIGNKLGIVPENIFHSMKPDQKMEKIKELKSQYKLAMIGDGINDAPALALADVGIAMGVAGTDVALETADIAIMSDDLYQLVKSINIGKQMKSTIIQNIILSSIILVGLLVAVLLGSVTMTQAILVHEGTEVLIVANAMRLLFNK